MYGPWHSERLTYRAVEPEDDAFLYTFNDEEGFINAAPFVPTPRSKKSASSHREWLEKSYLGAIICLPPPTATSTTAAGGDDATTRPIPIGTITLFGDEERQAHHRRVTIGITITQRYQGQGYGSEAIKWALHFAFHYGQMHRVEIGAIGRNTGAIKLYESLGFVLEGRKRDWWWTDGKYWDLHTLSMLEDEWRDMYGNRDQS